MSEQDKILDEWILNFKEALHSPNPKEQLKNFFYGIETEAYNRALDDVTGAFDSSIVALLRKQPKNNQFEIEKDAYKRALENITLLLNTKLLAMYLSDVEPPEILPRKAEVLPFPLNNGGKNDPTQ